MDRPPKKPKVVMGPIVGETPDTSKLPPKLGLGRGKGLMTGADPVVEKCPVLLFEDSGYALKQLSSIIKDNDDYEDLGNHATKAMGEKVEARDVELRELMVWKEVQVNKLDLTKQLLKESEAQVEALKKILKDKEAEISEAKRHLCQA